MYNPVYIGVLMLAKFRFHYTLSYNNVLINVCNTNNTVHSQLLCVNITQNTTTNAITFLLSLFIFSLFYDMVYVISVYFMMVI